MVTTEQIIADAIAVKMGELQNKVRSIDRYAEMIIKNTLTTPTTKEAIDAYSRTLDKLYKRVKCAVHKNTKEFIENSLTTTQIAENIPHKLWVVAITKEEAIATFVSVQLSILQNIVERFYP